MPRKKKAGPTEWEKAGLSKSTYYRRLNEAKNGKPPKGKKAEGWKIVAVHSGQGAEIGDTMSIDTTVDEINADLRQHEAGARAALVKDFMQKAEFELEHEPESAVIHVITFSQLRAVYMALAKAGHA